MPVIPGAATPTEMETAHRLGADLIKVFPAPAGGVGFIEAIRGPLPHLRLFPTAGVTPDNVVDYLRAGCYGAGFVRSLFRADGSRQAKLSSAIRQRVPSGLCRLSREATTEVLHANGAVWRLDDASSGVSWLGAPGRPRTVSDDSGPARPLWYGPIATMLRL